jgi:hypothetical protein
MSCCTDTQEPARMVNAPCKPTGAHTHEQMAFTAQSVCKKKKSRSEIKKTLVYVKVVQQGSTQEDGSKRDREKNWLD